MRILLTNDDGIDAPGFRALYDAVKPLGEIAISAPDQQASATGHSISLNTPFKVQKDDSFGIEHAYRVSSTPADCVRTAVLKLLPWQPDLVISGINQGANYGTLILYSGTVAAAAEAVILGIPAIAISLTSHVYKNFETSAAFAAQLTQWVGQMGMEPGLLLNVNVPPLERGQIKGTVLTHQGKFRHIDDLEPHKDLAGHFAYVLDSPTAKVQEHPDSDVSKVQEGYVSVTPLHLDLTARQHWTPLSKWPWNDRGWTR
jgi:5'-nucleotidase